MANDISDDDLGRIWNRWHPYSIPSQIEEKAWNLTKKRNAKISDMVFRMGEFGNHAAAAMGKKVAETVGRPDVLCYYIGYELASGRMPRDEGTPYLLAATKPIDNMVMTILEALVRFGRVTQQEGSSITLEIAKLTGEAANNLCILGINNFKKLASG